MSKTTAVAVCGWWSIPGFATSWCPLPEGHDGKHAASVTADVTREPTGGQGLREAIVRGLARVHGASYVEWADAVLALPELAALIADADNWRRVTTGDPTEPEPLAMQARELLLRVRRVRALADRLDDLAEMNDETFASLRSLGARSRHAGLRDAYTDASASLRQALDGDQ